MIPSFFFSNNVRCISICTCYLLLFSQLEKALSPNQLHLKRSRCEKCSSQIPFNPSKRKQYLSWDDYFMSIAFLSAERSKDPNRQVGSCLVSQNGVILGFSTAFLKKKSIAIKVHMSTNESNIKVLVREPKPPTTKAALLVILEKFFEVVINLPAVNRRLSDVLSLLSSRQPKNPRLYMYSSVDRVIPTMFIESFVEEQRRARHEFKACNFMTTPHADHFKNDP